MNFGAKKPRIEMIKKGVFGGMYFRDIYSGGTKNHGKNSIS